MNEETLKELTASVKQLAHHTGSLQMQTEQLGAKQQAVGIALVAALDRLTAAIIAGTDRK